LREEEQRKFATAHRNAWLVDFKRDFTARDDKWLAKVAAALVEMNMHFRDLDRRLATNEWLIDAIFTLAAAGARAMFASYAAKRRSEGKNVVVLTDDS
jgi:hypothetical protein